MIFPNTNKSKVAILNNLLPVKGLKMREEISLQLSYVEPETKSKAKQKEPNKMHKLKYLLIKV